MDPINVRVDAVRDAVASISTCTPAISATVKELLQNLDIEPDSSNATSKSRSTKASRPPSRVNTAPGAQRIKDNGGSLTARERAVLATQIITATLKALGEAGKVASSTSSDIRDPSKNDLAKIVARKAIQRSTSAPMKPLQPRSLNRTSTSPAVPKIPQSPTSIASSTGCLSTIECARAAFAALRALQASKIVQLPELQLESGLSSFVAKLIGLDMFEQAAKELRILKQRLERMIHGDNFMETTTRKRTDSNATSRTLSELLDFPKVTSSGPLLGLIISSQIHALRVIHGLKKSSHLESILPFLRESHLSSPMNLLLMSLKDENPDQTKCARQLENLSQILLSLPPSISPKDDEFAVEPRLSPSPAVALEIQALGLTIRLVSWSVSGHRGDVDKDVLFPLSKCLAAFTRRASPGHFDTAFSAFSQVWKRVEKLGLRPQESSKSPLAAIYQVLATTSRDSGNVNEAKKWLAKLKSLVNPSEDSAARCLAVTAQLLALSLKESTQVNEGLLREVSEGLRGPLGGTSAEMDDLLDSVCLLRKSVMSLITGKQDKSGKVSHDIRQLLETFVFQLPRFSSRWLGKPPTSANTTKELLSFDQRRGLLKTYLPHILDSALMLAKLLLDQDRLAWEMLDPTLQDSLAILEVIGNLSQPGAKANSSPLYHVKISHFYYQQHLVLRKSPSKAMESTSLKALRKSIESVKSRSEAEQVRAQLLVKWERFADLCGASGRLDDAIDALRSIRDHLVRQEIVSTITAKLATEPWWSAWQQCPNAELLSRTVCNLSKLDRKHNDWTWLLVGSDKATALEHDLYTIISKDNRYRSESDLSSPPIKTLLQFYSADKFPIRRLRTLLQVLTINMGSLDGLDDMRTEVEAVLKVTREEALANDSGLARYIPHLQALAACVFGLVDSNIGTRQVKTAISSWKSMVSKCQSAEQLSFYIDNTSQLLANLQSLVDFARIKGLDALQIDILELCQSISKLSTDCSPELLITQSLALCRQHLSHGWSSKAEQLLNDNYELISQPRITKDLAIRFYLSAAEYHLSLGALDKAEQHLCNAQHAESALASEPGAKRTKSSKRMITTAHAYSISSSLALERGDCYHALRFARIAVRKLFHDWTRLEKTRSVAQDTSMEDSSQTEASDKDTSLNGSFINKAEFLQASTGPEFWALAYPLFRFLLQLSTAYAHVGMYQETLYYAEQAQKVAKSMGSAAYVSRSLTWLAQVWLMAGKLEKAMELAAEANPIAYGLEPTYENAKVLCLLSSVYGEIKDPEAQEKLIEKAEYMLKILNSDQSTSDWITEDLESGMAELAIEEKPVVKTTGRRTATKIPRVVSKAKKVTKVTKVTKAASRKPTTKKSPTKITPPTEITTTQHNPEDTQLSFLRASILQHQSNRLLGENDWASAVTTLRTAYELCKLPTDVSQACFLMGVALIGQGLDQMGQDAVFSVIQDSTLSFPSVAGSLKERTASNRLSLTKASAPRKGRAPSKKAQDNTRSFVEKLREAQGHLLTAHSIASLNGDGYLVHRIATVLQNVVILLSNTNSLKPAATHPAHATCSVELARNLTWRRERKTLHLEAAKELKLDWPIPTDSAEARRSSLGFSLDMDRFQSDYIDIIPKSWNVISVSLSDSEHDLCITKLQRNQNPFGIRLPLERASSRDADSEVFSFRQGRTELLEIIKVANLTCHNARDMSKTGAKSAWWAEREQLDERLKNLMECIEQTWLGGFRGILSQHQRQADLFAEFENRFQGILDKHLSSRQQVNGRKTQAAPTGRVSLDPRIYDLFIGLGDPSGRGADLDEALTDLLYFVIDILQFHGERNAYDEIDFDAMAVETCDALRSYYVAVKGRKEAGEGVHTILVLDKSLHAFPWESLPCLQGLATSRVPSLDCLRRLILESKSTSPETTDEDDDELNGSAQRDGHYASINSGTYILNPGSDLKNTQNTFGDALSSLPLAWESVEMREPTEAEFEKALAEKDLLLYFGHGSGAQYIRGRTIRKMDKCRAAALLMGCSSASLADVGRFECHGPVWNYMLAGCPAVVGTLWDVTDRDIDRFAGKVFEEWGLMPRGTFAEVTSGKGKKASRSKGKKATTAGQEGVVGMRGQTSLVEAVASARDACRFRYLTAAAVCVYGIPVYIHKS
ncbi:peptidase family C50-domain-containing protein [Hypoxylon fragiforme]|uniref:peptidase family C50-domain-containing protein n=1 Tax=Hypoxylon fragiforme TaxID=63214 RepID=UPI0020C65766|nr:peptidase family C50-domain-containing protein [Hypoxylon fragiforme]KAI2612077.1 peptidase family C50-domain-containing protein [Hypoxylon fragiforme]